MTQHIFVKHKSYDECSGPPAMCPICDGGLSLCSVCGLSEGALTSDCPGENCSDLSDVVYKGAIDYVGGEWVVKEDASELFERLCELHRAWLAYKVIEPPFGGRDDHGDK